MKNHYTLLLLLSINNCLSQVSDFKHVSFEKADNIAKLNKGEGLYNLPLLTHKLTNKLDTDVEKFRAIYTWVSTNIKGDYKQHTKVSRKRKELKNDSLKYINWNNKYKKVAFKKLLKHKKTMCTGYAYLIKEMAFLAGLESKIIDGYARTVTSNIDSIEMANHSWNAVKINNKWYLCDATWSSGYMIKNGIFIPDYNDGYFLTDPTLFAKNHFPIKKKWLLNSKTTVNGFTTSPLLYNQAFKYKIFTVYPSKMNVTINKNSEINFKYSTLKNITNEKISLIYYLGNEEKKLTLFNINNNNGSLSFNHKFQKKGNFDIHLKINKDIVATYTFKVLK